MLILRNTSVGAIEDYLRTSWPEKLDLNGFTYRNLGGLSRPDNPDPMINRTAKWFKGWLREQDPYAPAPYQRRDDLTLPMRFCTPAVSAIVVIHAGAAPAGVSG
jgi:hypothetical protein